MAGLIFLLAVFYIARASVHGQSTTGSVSSAACSSTITPQHAQPSVAPGWSAQVIAAGFTRPRGLVFDQEGHLLVVDLGQGISSITLTSDDGPCVRVDGEPQRIISDERVSGSIFTSETGSRVQNFDPDSSCNMELNFQQMAGRCMLRLHQQCLLGIMIPPKAAIRLDLAKLSGRWAEKTAILRERC
jgi:hypothetical protein